MGAARGIAAIVRAVAEGTAAPAERARLSRAGVAAVRALLDCAANPPGRHLRDVDDDLMDALHAIARRDPQSLIDVLSVRDDQAHRLAFALGSSKKRAAVDALLGLLAHRDAGVRAAAAGSLARIGTKRALAPLPALLRDRSDKVRWQALTAIEAHLRPGVESLVEEYLDRTDLLPGGVRIACSILARLDAGSASPAAAAAAAAYGRRDDETVAALLRVLDDGSAHARHEAVWSLSWAGTRSAVKPLPGLVRDSNLGVRVAALVALGVHRPPGTATAVRALRRRKDLRAVERRLAQAVVARRDR